MIWIIGNNGMLAKQIQDELINNSISYIGTDKEVDVTDLNALNKFCSEKELHWIINCSAYTAVDKAEDENELCYSINSNAVANIANIANQKNAILIHFSTDYVFNGDNDKPYSETDKTDPQSVYGKSKYEGEVAVTSLLNRYFIIRTAWLYGKYGKNFVNTMLNLFKDRDTVSVVNDQFGSPTSAKDLAEAVVSLIKNDETCYGTYHYTNEGEISWFDFSSSIYEIGLESGILQKEVKITPIMSDKFPTKAKRPKFSCLDKAKINSLTHIQTKFWKDSLRNYLIEYKNIV